MSMAEAFVSMYSDSASDAEFDDDLTSVTQLSVSPSSSSSNTTYNYTPSPPNRLNQSRTYSSPSRYSLTRQRLEYSPDKWTSEDFKSKGGAFHQDGSDDSVLYTTAVEESFSVDRSTTLVVGRTNSVVGGASESMHVTYSSLNCTYTVGGRSNRGCKKRVDLLCDSFSHLTTSSTSSQSRQTSSAACSTPPTSSTRQCRQTGYSSCAASSTHQSGQTSSTPSSLDCSFAADIRVQIPEKLRSLTESELRERLVALGERPGPITPSTKVAYLAYLAKLEAGVQPAGNKGYKGKRRREGGERDGV